MTILPNKVLGCSHGNSNQGTSGGNRPRTPPQQENQNVVSVGVVGPSALPVGWGNPSTSPSGPPNVSPPWSLNNPPGSSSPGSSSRIGEGGGCEKRTACSPQPYDFEDDCGPPASSKRRIHHNTRSTSKQSPLHRPPVTPSPPLASTSGNHDNSNSGYNSEDEYSHLGVQLTEEEWLEKDRRFERTMKKKDYIIKKMKDDGSCLFRAVADQIFGDQEMHEIVRNHCMDYILQNGDYFSQYLTEDINDYVERKRFLGVHGNHLEIQALSEMYNRPIHIYCYSSEPINIFQNVNKDLGGGHNNSINAPIRLCYHREVHYNSLVDPNAPSIGVGLGLPNYKHGTSTDRKQVDAALKASHNEQIEKAMLEDKIKATDWEATNEVIEEQVARESYLQWLRDNERRNSGMASRTSVSATVTSGDLRCSSPKGLSSPKAGPSSKLSLNGLSSPKAGCSSDRDSPKPGSSQQYNNKLTTSMTDSGGIGSNFKLLENGSFINGLPPHMFGLENWNDADVLTQVLAASQQEYLDSLKPTTSASSSTSPSNPSGSPSSVEQQRKKGDSPKNRKKDK